MLTDYVKFLYCTLQKLFLFLFQAGLILRVLIFSSVCGGTLISDSRVLTAAHCINDGNNIAQSVQVILGSNFLFSGGIRIDTSDVALYPGYNPWIAANDLAVLRFPAVTFSRKWFYFGFVYNMYLKQKWTSEFYLGFLPKD